ncbi:ankyrin repeat protein [Variovorax boronicumulans]|uniref:ankyrin repeat domain-containing protein n=1 Tax=Variovorax boronicumulans TaxID=436515 RepID=UPI0024738C4F|nr:ankyrin repeat domain-containing protein [Variovorax boronicumulans]MDH6166784.1 ankyrin repeat protein [Variovorax boronicumulans]
MKRIPARPDLGHLKKQAKELLAGYRGGDLAALARFRESLPVAADKDDAAIAALGLRLHGAQSCLAREYGFVSWVDLQGFVLARIAQANDPARAVMLWLRAAYAGEISGGNNLARPALAARLLEESPGLLGDDPYLACAVGDEDLLRQAIARDPEWVLRAGGPLLLPPLNAVAHSSLVQLPAFRERLRACAKLLLDAGADPNRAIGSRWPPASLAAPSETDRLSALYGAAGQNRDVEITQLLLDAGADPNDGESLYHSLEEPACTRLLLKAGARVEGTNALYRVLDLDRLESLQLLLAHGGDPNEAAPGEPTSDWGRPLLWAIRRRRSAAHIEALLDAGADATVRTPEGIDAHTLALRFGLTDVARVIAQRTGGNAQLPPDEQFIAACARGDEPAARRIQAEHPQVLAMLSPTQLRLLPELAAQPGCGEAVQLMVELGWPIATTGGDWEASALNQAVFRGDAALTRFLLSHGATWTERHGFGDDVSGSLSWASLNQPTKDGDWVGCAEALVAHGFPTALPDPGGSDGVLVGGRLGRFSDEVTDFLLGASRAP